VVLAYHEVPDRDAFAWQLDYLRTMMQPVSLSAVLDAIRAGTSLPRRAVLITFDDGDRTIYEQALPVLRDRNLPAVAFVVAGLLGTDTPFWWREVEGLVGRGARMPLLPSQPAACVAELKRVPNAERQAWIAELRRSLDGPPVRMRQLDAAEIRALDAAGVAIGNHTFTHPCLDRCPPQVVEAELRQAHETLTGILGRAPLVFAYPNGNADLRAETLLGDLGYEAAFLFDHRISAFPPADPYRVSRVRIGSTVSPDRFRILVSGLHSSVHHFVGRS
jgi:peptidoglycan/xylan/chitin deacetylase (PgdA/CDA1 family)